MLRDYQLKQNGEIVNGWQEGKRNILSVMPTGAGKTVCMSNMFHRCNCASIAIAHRNELVSQISLALARCGIYHNIVAPDPIIRFIVFVHIRETGRSWFKAGAKTTVSGIDTLLKRKDINDLFLQIRLWQVDEAHHIAEDNKWMKGIDLFPNAFGIGWTATPMRTDKKSLWRGAGGAFDKMILGPSMRDLINQNHLADYIIYGPPNAIDISRVKISETTGDFNSNDLRTEAHKSEITGDIVAHYLRYAAGKRGVTFAVDVGLAEEHAEAFRAAGVPAAVVHAKTGDKDRFEKIEALRRGELLQLVNVDIFGEGFDLPAIEVVSMARPTESYGLFVQQFGRALRPAPGKARGIIIDHVGNTARLASRYGMPDRKRDWVLETYSPEVRPGAETPVRQCRNPECFLVYEGFSTRCPYCGHKPAPAARDRPDLVEGDLTEYSPDLLASLRAEADRIGHKLRDPGKIPKGLEAIKRENHEERRQAQADLKDALAWWGGVQRDLFQLDLGGSYRKFYRRFGVDVATAQTLPAREQSELWSLIWADIDREAKQV